MPDSTLTVPASGMPYYKPSDLNTIAGTLTAANTAQIRIINETNNTVWISTSNMWISTFTYLAGCNDNTYIVGQSTCGFFGVDSVDWTKDVTGIWPGGTNKFSVKVRAAADATLEATPYDERFFYIDGDAPSFSLVSRMLLMKRCASVYGTATDAGEGVITKIEILISTNSQSSFWNGSQWVAISTWLNASPVDGSFNSNYEGWSLSSNLPVFEDGKIYELQVKATDKASNTKLYPPTYLSFTIDRSSPLAAISLPDGSVPLNSIPYIKGTATDGSDAIHKMIRYR